MESATIKWIVTAMHDCRIIEAFFIENPLVGAKQRAFEIWRQCLIVIQQNRHTSTDGFQEIIALRSEINQNRRPSSFRDEDHLIASALPVINARLLEVWTTEEKQKIKDYISEGGDRERLIDELGRSTASVANQITRQRRAQRKAQKGT